MSKIVSAIKNNGKLLSITLAIDDSESFIYNKLIQSEFSNMKCPKCNETMDVHPDDMHLIIDSPLYHNNVGFETAIPEFYCNNCKNKIRFNMIDMTPFTTEINFLLILRDKYKKKKEKLNEKEGK